MVFLKRYIIGAFLAVDKSMLSMILNKLAGFSRPIFSTWMDSIMMSSFISEPSILLNVDEA